MRFVEEQWAKHYLSSTGFKASFETFDVLLPLDSFILQGKYLLKIITVLMIRQVITSPIVHKTTTTYMHENHDKNNLRQNKKDQHLKQSRQGSIKQDI